MRHKLIQYQNCKYIHLKDFIKFCEQNSVKINQKDLEIYEREKLLFPLKRLICPEEYAIYNYLFPIRQTRIEEIESKYLPLTQLQEELSKFNSGLYPVIEHPFDKKIDCQGYLFVPETMVFKEWKNYEINYIDENKQRWKITIFKNFYSYWQIYELDSINAFKKIYCEIQFDIEKERFFRTCNKEIIEKWKLSKNEIIGLLSFERHYHCLCEFIQFFNRNWNITFKPGEPIKPSELAIFEEEMIKNSKKIIQDFSINDLYGFLKMLCLKYFDYGKNDKINLQNLIKTDIFYCIRLIIFVSGSTFQEVSTVIGESGHYGTYYKDYTRARKKTIEIIFPNEEENIKERAMIHLNMYLNEYNKNVHKEDFLSNQDFINLIEFIEKNGLSHMLILMIEANTDYFSNEYSSNKKLIFHLRNLSIFIEEISKEIRLNAKSKEIREKSQDKPGLRDILHPICNTENWWKGYEFLNSNGMFSYINKDNIGDKIDGIIRNIESYSKTPLDSKDKFVLINISIATIIRNFYAHNSVSQEIVNKEYSIRVNSLINSILIIWTLGKKLL